MTRPIHRLLVANRGEIARRVFATCRRLGIGTVAVFSEPDADAPFVAEADQAIRLGGVTPSESYLRGDVIIGAALRSRADAIHPGYGFLSENYDFARQVIDAGLTWIGPAPESISAMGSKADALDHMRAAGVPVLSGRRLTDEKADELIAAGAGVGYPLMVKASAGGGGKGMRRIASQSDLLAGVEGARREAVRAFGDGTLYLERYLDRARHVEIQILGDVYGSVVALGERDCSVQRRHQKVIEESPSPALDTDVRAAMLAAAVKAGEALGYVGAGTVEFLLGEDQQFVFLEMNTRLQVEHPVTELVTGLDLVELQIRVAAGEAVPVGARESRSNGHAIEARLYAEDAARGFLPATGTLTRFTVPDTVRVDSGVGDGSVVEPHYDPMLAKVIAVGDSRADAARILADALARTEVHGVTTNRDFLVRVLRHPDFLSGKADTTFLERADPADLTAPLIDADGESLAAAAAALVHQAGRRVATRILATAPSGWRNVPMHPQRVTYANSDGRLIDVEYRFDRHGLLAHLAVNGQPLEHPIMRHRTSNLIDLEVAGSQVRYRVHTDPRGSTYVNLPDGQAALHPISRHPRRAEHGHPDSLVSPMPGAVVGVNVRVGDQVVAGTALFVIEAMKMEHEITAPFDGMVSELHVSAGSQVEAGVVLGVITADEQQPHRTHGAPTPSETSGKAAG